MTPQLKNEDATLACLDHGLSGHQSEPSTSGHACDSHGRWGIASVWPGLNVQLSILYLA